MISGICRQRRSRSRYGRRDRHDDVRSSGKRGQHDHCPVAANQRPARGLASAGSYQEPKAGRWANVPGESLRPVPSPSLTACEGTRTYLLPWRRAGALRTAFPRSDSSFHTRRGAGQRHACPPRLRPLPNSPVFALDDDESAAVLKAAGDIRLGLVVGYNKVVVGVPSDKKFVLPRHTAVLGTTGGGKSTTIARLVQQAQAAKMAVILLDVEGEYTHLHEPTTNAEMLAASKNDVWIPPVSPII